MRIPLTHNTRIREQPIAKAFAGLLRGGTTISDAKKGTMVPGTNTHDDIGAAGYTSIVFSAASGVTSQAPGGENPLQDENKKQKLRNVEYERLSRAKFLEDRKAKLTKAQQSKLQTETNTTVSHFTKVAETKTKTLPQDIIEWVESFWRVEEEIEGEKKKVKKTDSKNFELITVAARNAREAAVRARQEMELARSAMLAVSLTHSLTHTRTHTQPRLLEHSLLERSLSLCLSFALAQETQLIYKHEV